LEKRNRHRFCCQPKAVTAGTYYIKATDSSTECFDIKPVVVAVYPRINFGVDTLNASCNQSNGSITIKDVSGGSSNSYEYSKDSGRNYRDAKVFDSLDAGIYRIVVRNTEGAQCESDPQDITVTNTGSSLEVKARSTPADCNQDNGTITVTVTGGSGKYQYSKDGGETFQDSSGIFVFGPTKLFDKLAAGTYKIVVWDNEGAQCKSDVQEVPITQNGTDLKFEVTTKPATCGQSNGSITVTASGGVGGGYWYSKTMEEIMSSLMIPFLFFLI
jgi:hypothetical protein